MNEVSTKTFVNILKQPIINIHNSWKFNAGKYLLLKKSSEIPCQLMYK
jgi:hypothetical protein